jgi:hypothetical protein
LGEVVAFCGTGLLKEAAAAGCRRPKAGLPATAFEKNRRDSKTTANSTYISPKFTFSMK